MRPRNICMRGSWKRCSWIFSVHSCMKRKRHLIFPSGRRHPLRITIRTTESIYSKTRTKIMDTWKSLSPLKPIHRHDARKRLIDDMVAAGDNRNFVTADSLWFLHRITSPTTHREARSRLSGNAKNVHSPFMIIYRNTVFLVQPAAP